MGIPRTIGLPRMHKEPGEQRVFLPDFVQFLTRLGAEVYLEEGLGSASGYTFSDYRQGNDRVRRCIPEQAFQQDMVLVLRAPERAEFDLLGAGSCLISMLHFPTRPWRIEKLLSMGARAISIDSIVDDNNLRMVENMAAVAWNGIEAGFDVLEKRWPDLRRPDGLPIQVVVLGTGMVGKYAVDAVTKLGRVERNQAHMAAGGRGAVALAVGRNVTCHPETMRRLMQQADLLVDATQRRDTSKPVVSNEWLRWLPHHTVIVDLSVDPYLPDAAPPVVRGVEGIPQGNLDQYIFYPDDPNWTRGIPPDVPTAQRRTVVSCYSWPGIHPEACMEHYARQLKPLMEVLFAKGYDNLSLQGGYFERALARATLHEWLAIYR